MPGRRDGKVERDDVVTADLNVLISATAERHPEFRTNMEDTENWLGLLRELAQLRRRKRISQKEVARRMSTTQSAISEMEKGIVEPRISTLLRYARILGYKLLPVRVKDSYTNRALYYSRSFAADVRPSAGAWRNEAPKDTAQPVDDRVARLGNVHYVRFERKDDTLLGETLAAHLNRTATA